MAPRIGGMSPEFKVKQPKITTPNGSDNGVSKLTNIIPNEVAPPPTSTTPEGNKHIIATVKGNITLHNTVCSNHSVSQMYREYLENPQDEEPTNTPPPNNNENRGKNVKTGNSNPVKSRFFNNNNTVRNTIKENRDRFIQERISSNGATSSPTNNNNSSQTTTKSFFQGTTNTFFNQLLTAPQNTSSNETSQVMEPGIKPIEISADPTATQTAINSNVNPESLRNAVVNATDDNRGEVQKQLNDADTSINKTLQQNANAIKTLTDEKNKANQFTECYQETIDLYEKQSVNQKEKLDIAQKELDETIRNRDEKDAELSKYHEEYGTLCDTLKNQESNVTNNQKNYDLKRKNTSDCQNKQEAATANVKALETQLSQIDQANNPKQYSAIQAKLEQAKQNETEAKANYERALQESADAKELLEQSKQELEKIQDQKEEMLEQLKQTDTEHQELINACDTLNEDVICQQSDVEIAAEEYTQSLETVELYKSKLESTQGIIQEYDNAIATLQNTQNTAGEVKEIKQEFDNSGNPVSSTPDGNSDSPAPTAQPRNSNSDNGIVQKGNQRYLQANADYLKRQGYDIDQLLADGIDIDMKAKNVKMDIAMNRANGVR